jgi:hypothetical protein
MKTIKYILFLFLFMIISCKTSSITKESTKKLEISETEPYDVDNINSLSHDLVDCYDTDEDGVLDIYDRCPYIKGTLSNGCPEIKDKGPKIKDKESKENNIHTSPSDKVNNSIKKEKPNTIVIDPQYTEGLIAYKIPTDMIVGNIYSVKIRITKESNKTMLVVGDRNIPISDDKSDIVSVESISVSPVMSASLLSDKGTFQVDTLSTQYQNISERGYTEWEWNIVPLKGGHNLLKLNVKIRIKEDNKSYYKDIVVFDRKIKVKSNIKFSIITWISVHWEWLFGVILIPLIKWLYDEWKKRKEEK